MSERLREHIRTRPGWDCRACGNPWPCAEAKMDLLSEFQTFPSVLRTYLAAQMCDAIDDLTVHGGPVPPDLYGRFLGWTRRRRRAQPVAGAAGP